MFSTKTYNSQSRRTSGRSTNTSLFPDAPDPAAAWCCCHWACLRLIGCGLRVGCAACEGVIETSVGFIHLIDQGVPNSVTDSGTIQEIAAFYPGKAAWIRRRVRVAQRIFLQYVPNPGQYAESHIPKNPGVCLENCMPDVLHTVIRITRQYQPDPRKLFFVFQQM